MTFWPALAPLSCVYGAVAGVRNLAYDLKIFRAADPPPHIISVGNLTAGGSGKTPVIIDLAQRIVRNYPDVRVAVVSRGYRRKSSGPQIVSTPGEILLDSSQGGDEPYLIASSVPGLPVVVAQKRIEGVELAVREFGAQMILLDDGFQHRALARNSDIVLLNADIPAWHWRLLPAGRMRESAISLKRANLVILTGKDHLHRKEKLRSWVQKYSVAPVISGSLEPDSIQNIHTREKKDLSWLKNREVAVACGIANPGGF